MKNGTCPICRRKIIAPNCWVRFHVRYGKRPIVILACRDCNWCEMILRTKAYNDPEAFLRRSLYQPNNPTRAEILISNMKNLDIDLFFSYPDRNFSAVVQAERASCASADKNCMSRLRRDLCGARNIRHDVSTGVACRGGCPASCRILRSISFR